jgi:outer membrane protein TolC
MRGRRAAPDSPKRALDRNGSAPDPGRRGDRGLQVIVVSCAALPWRGGFLDCKTYSADAPHCELGLFMGWIGKGTRLVRVGSLCRLLPVVLVAGCAHYKPMPLTGPAVDQALVTPNERELTTRANQIKHPLLHPVPIDLQNGLTPDSAALLAVIINPSLRAERNRRAVASAQLVQAQLLPNPTLDFTFDPVTGGNTLGAKNAYSVGPSWEVTALITHEAKVAAARAESDSVRLDVAWQEWQFAQAAKKAVYDLISLREQLKETQTVDRQVAEELALVRRAVDAHQQTLLELSAAQTASEKAHADFLAAQRESMHQQLALNQALGLGPEVQVRLADNVELPSKLQLPPDQELSADLDGRRLDLLALRRGYESQEQTLRAAVLGQFPRIVLGVHQASDNTGVQSTGFGVTVDLPIFDRNQGNIAIQTATRQQLFDEYTGRIFEARSTIAQTMADIRSITDQIATAEAAIPALEELVRTYQAAVAQHNADVLSYYLAQNDLSQKRIDLLKLKQQLMDNQIALEIASGRYMPAPPTSGPASRPAMAEARP